MLHHKVGTANNKADLLSQQVDHEQGKEDNDEIVVLKPKHFWTMIMPTIEETYEKIKSTTCNHWLWDQNIHGSVNHDWGMILKERLIYYDGRIYILWDHTLQREIIAHSHEHVTVGHLGIEKTKELVLQEYWWPKMKRDTEAYIWACETCQWTKSSTQAKAAHLHPNIIPSWPWTHILVDMITDLPDCQGYDTIIMIVDHFSKEIIPIACSKQLSSEGWVKILWDKVYAKHSMPQVVISDQGPQFVSNFMKDL